ncbi:MAG: ribonuclease III family protein [Euryarchaeota archaeon]|nr:ribonuclease III family protein [Euryarchaeota archaeon]MBU4144122.1 hypothetical protein [Candidatus Thermoplasmatota archaeon]
MTGEEQEKEIRKFLHVKLKIDNPDKFQLYVEALTHSVDSNKEPGLRNNGRLAYLGDFVINFSIGHYCFDKYYPEGDKGDMTILSNELRSDVILSQRAEPFFTGHPNIIFVADSKTERNTTFYAKALEALFGAIYLDQGFEKARALAEEHLLQSDQ